MGTILGIILFIPLAIVLTIALVTGGIIGGLDGIDAAGNIFIVAIELGVFIWVLVSCLG